MVCPPCQKGPHNSKPKDCKGGTWCDCQHRSDATQMNEESTTSSKLVDQGDGTNV